MLSVRLSVNSRLLNWGESKVIGGLLIAWGSAPLIPVSFRSQFYIHSGFSTHYSLQYAADLHFFLLSPSTL